MSYVPPLWITREQAADMLQVGLSKLDQLSHEPGFPVAIRQHRMVRFNREEMVEWAKTYNKRQLTVVEPETPPAPRRRRRGQPQ